MKGRRDELAYRSMRVRVGQRGGCDGDRARRRILSRCGAENRAEHIHLQDGVIRGWYDYYQLAENVGCLNYARYVLQYSLAKTLARKERLTVAKVFRTYGKHITFTKPNGRVVCFCNAPLIQVKKAKTKAGVDAVPNWGPRRTQTRLLDSCVICGDPERV
jgi:hypothetical protein